MTQSSYCAKRHQHLFCLNSGQQTALTWILSTTASRDVYSSVYTRRWWTLLGNWSNVWLRSGPAYSRLLSMRRLPSGDAISGPASAQRDVILNICCNIDCSMSSADIFTLNSQTCHDCWRFLFQSMQVSGFLTHYVNTYYEINLSWYPVSSKLTSYICKLWKLIVYSLCQKLWILISICRR